MTVTTWATNENFTVRIYKRITSRPDTLWANTYELTATDDIPLGADAALEAIRIIAQWESKFHLNDVEFDRGVFSTYVNDGEEYDPSDFVVTGLPEYVGLRIPASDQPLALDQCYFVRRSVAFGRSGRLLYRRVLLESDVDAPAGKTRLSSASRNTLQGLLDAPVGEPFPPFGVLQALNDISLSMVMILRDGVGSGEKRVVRGFDSVGVTTKKLNNAFFNRRTPPLP